MTDARGCDRVLLVSTYELGHQPLHVASPAAALRAAGHEVRALDLSLDGLDAEVLAWADRVAFSAPMHTAMRLALEAAAQVRSARPALPVAVYGLYAPVGSDRTVGSLVDAAFAGEYEPALVAWAAEGASGGGAASSGEGASSGVEGAARGQIVQLGRSSFRLPARDLLPPLDRYAHLVVGDERRTVGYTEASHGCSFRCRHCPVPTVYDGRVRTVAEEVVVGDVDQLVAAGARHLTFGDPDFLNSPPHACRVVRAVHERHPDLTFDLTTKVELVLRHHDLWAELAAAGCLFVVSAFEAVDEATLVRLDKGHTAADEATAVSLLRSHGIEVRPSWMPFTPWSTPDDLVALLDFVADHGLAANVDPVQYTIRLLLPDGSLLLAHPDLAPHLGGYDAEHLSWSWTSVDPRSDALQAELAALVERHTAADEPPWATYLAIDGAVRAAAGVPDRADLDPAALADAWARTPRLSEPWFCCAEPTDRQRHQTP